MTSKEDNHVVVRIRRSWYRSRRGLACRVEIDYVKRYCKGFNFMEEDISCAGAEDVALMITNLDECKDGLYRVVLNPYRDWETGIADDWDYTLKPFVPE